MDLDKDENDFLNNINLSIKRLFALRSSLDASRSLSREGEFQQNLISKWQVEVLAELKIISAFLTGVVFKNDHYILQELEPCFKLYSTILAILNELSELALSTGNANSQDFKSLAEICLLTTKNLEAVYISFHDLKKTYIIKNEVLENEHIKSHIHEASKITLLLLSNTLSIVSSWAKCKDSNYSSEISDDEKCMFRILFKIVQYSAENNELRILVIMWKEIDKLLNVKPFIYSKDIITESASVLHNCILLHINFMCKGKSILNIDRNDVFPIMRFYISHLGLHLSKVNDCSDYSTMLYLREAMRLICEVMFIADDVECCAERGKTMKAFNNTIEKFLDSNICSSEEKCINALILLGILNFNLHCNNFLDSSAQKKPLVCYNDYNSQLKNLAITLLNSIVLRNLLIDDNGLQLALLSKPFKILNLRDEAIKNFQFLTSSVLNNIFDILSHISPLAVYQNNTNDTSLYQHLLISTISFLHEICDEAWEYVEKDFFSILLRPKNIVCYTLVLDIVKFFQKKKKIDFPVTWINECIPFILLNIPFNSVVNVYLKNASQFLDISVNKSIFPSLPPNLNDNEPNINSLLHLSNMPIPYSDVNEHIAYSLNVWRNLSHIIRSDTEDIKVRVESLCAIQIPALFSINIIERILSDKEFSFSNKILQFIREVSSSLPILIICAKKHINTCQEIFEIPAKIICQILSCYVTLCNLISATNKIVTDYDWRLDWFTNANSPNDNNCSLPKAAVYQTLSFASAELNMQNHTLKWLWSTDVWYEKLLALIGTTNALRSAAIKKECLTGFDIDIIRQFIKRDPDQKTDPKFKELAQIFISIHHDSNNDLLECLLQNACQRTKNIQR